MKSNPTDGMKRREDEKTMVIERRARELWTEVRELPERKRPRLPFPAGGYCHVLSAANQRR